MSGKGAEEKEPMMKEKAQAGQKKANGASEEKSSAKESKKSRGRSKSKTDTAATEVAEWKDRFLRLQADFDNLRKRTIREKNDLRRRANEDIILELLPALDHLDLALDAAVQHDAPDAFVEGFRLVSDQILAALGKSGVTVIDATGQEFDFHKHEAISHLPSDEVPENHVITQVRRGFMLGDLLLRAAQVVVSRGPANVDVDTGADATDEKTEEFEE